MNGGVCAEPRSSFITATNVTPESGRRKGSVKGGGGKGGGMRSL